MTSTEGFDLDGPWLEAADRIVLSMTEGVDPRDLILPVGESSHEGLERYAREYCAAGGNASLAVVYAVASVGVCTATQGAWTTLCPLAGGGYLEVPTIQYAMAVADSGVGKSTILDAAIRPLRRVLNRRGVDWRTRRMAELRQNAERFAREHLPEEQGLGARFDPKPFAEVFNSGICATTLVKDPTMEALGQILVNNGGHGTVASAEAEIFRSMSAYNPDGGSLSLLLDQWSQEQISTIRVTRGITEMDDVSLNLIVLFQSAVFADITGGVTGRPGGGDSFIERGVFGRAWAIRAAHLGGYERLARFYADVEDLEFLGDGMDLPGGEKTPLGWALHDYENTLGDLVEESNNYRAAKAIHRAWRLGLVANGADFQVPEPELPVRHEMRLSASARLAYRRVQRLRLYVESALADDRVDEDTKSVFVPLAARLTQHVMREAATISLGAGHRTVTAKAIEDAATRIIPWRVAHTADALLTRAAEVSQVAMAKAAVSNPNNIDTSVKGIVAKHLAMLASRRPSQRGEGFTRSVIREQVKQPLARQRGTGAGVGTLVQSALDELVADKQSGITINESGVDAVGNKVSRYIIADDAIAYWSR